MADKNPFDEIVAELVVFKHEDPNHHDGHYFSNSPMWADSRIRARWMELYSDEALGEDEDIADEEGDDYETWTNDELRGELAKRELSVEGKKVDLVARLREDDDKE